MLALVRWAHLKRPWRSTGSLYASSAQIIRRGSHLLDTGNGADARELQSITRPSKVGEFLAALRDASREPTPADLEGCRPSHHSNPKTPQYVEEYNNLVDTLCRSFSKIQLRRFAEMQGTSSTRKVQYAEWIIEKQWNWPSLSDIERQKRDTTEISSKTFSISPGQLFLLLGEDGTDLLLMSLRFNVHIALTPDPLTLQVEGVKSSLKKIGEQIAQLRSDIIEESFDLPTQTPIRQDLLQRVSRISNAFIENLDNKGTVRLCVSNPNNLVTARRLATRAASEEFASSLLVSYVPLDLSASAKVQPSLISRSYYAYPFLSPRSLHWSINPTGIHRVRKVREWLGLDASENIRKSGGLAGGRGRFLTLSRDSINLEEVLFNALVHIPDSTTSITASLGHLLIRAPKPDVEASVLASHSSMPQILDWLRDSGTKVDFTPSPPHSLLNSTPTRQRLLQRVIYHALPSSYAQGTTDGVGSSLGMHITQVIKFDIPLASPELPPLDTTFSMNTDSTAEDANEDANPRQTRLKFEPRGTMGSETVVDLMIPDRPLDIRFSVFSSSEIRFDEEPAELRPYFSELQAYLAGADESMARPKPPLSLTLNDRLYILHDNINIRQHLEPIPAIGIDAKTPSASSITMVTENILDLESNFKSTVRQISCGTSEESWNALLRACDYLTTYHGLVSEADLDGLEVV